MERVGKGEGLAAFYNESRVEKQGKLRTVVKQIPELGEIRFVEISQPDFRRECCAVGRAQTAAAARRGLWEIFDGENLARETEMVTVGIREGTA